MITRIYVDPTVNNGLWSTVLNGLAQSGRIELVSDIDGKYDCILTGSVRIPQTNRVPVIVAQSEGASKIAHEIGKLTGEKVAVALPMNLEERLSELFTIERKPETEEERIVGLTSRLRYNLQAAVESERP